MTGLNKLPYRWLWAFIVFMGMSLLLGVLAVDTRAAGLQADPPAVLHPLTLLEEPDPAAGNGLAMSSSVLTDTSNIYIPLALRDLPKACGQIITDTVWIASDGPVQVMCDVDVLADVALTIKAGVTVQFHPSDEPWPYPVPISIFVEGMLRVEGTEQDPVRFQPVSGTNPGSWDKINFWRGSSGLLDHAILEYGGVAGSYQYNSDGMVLIYSSAVQVLNSVIMGSGDAGIAVVDGASPLINATQFLSNTADTGGGVLIISGSPTVQNNIFKGNSAASGGGLYSASGEALILNNFFYGNAADNGGGLYLESGSAIVRNNIVVSNTASTGGGIIQVGGSPRLDYNDVWNNAGGDYAGYTPGAGDISADPLLVDLAGGDLHQTSVSPCLDAGDPYHHAAVDFEGDLRPMGLAPDIGPDEFPALGVVKSSSSEDAYPSGPVTYTIQVINTTPITFTNVQLTDTLPVESAFTSYQADDLSCTHDGAAWGGLLHCTQDSASLAPGESQALTLTVVLSESLAWHQFVTNTVSLTAKVGEDNFAARDNASIWMQWCKVQLNDTPFGEDLQAAIDASLQSTDVVKVSGTCFKHDLNLDKTLILQGGWNWNFSVQNPGVYTSTLDGQKLGRVIQVAGYISPTIEGFVITGGENYDGGGIYVLQASPTIQNNTFMGNEAEGVFNDWGNPIIQNNTFINNGDGVRNSNASPTIQNNTFIGQWDGVYNISGSPLIQDNTFTSYRGNGVVNQYGNPTVQNNSFTGNLHGGMLTYGGDPLILNNSFTGNQMSGLTVQGGNPTIQNNTFTGNVSDFMGGGLYINQASPMVYGNIFTGNSAEYAGGGLGIWGGGADIQNNLFIGNSANQGGGLYNWSDYTHIQNNLFISNTADLGGGLYLNVETLVRNNIVVNNSANTGGGVYYTWWYELEWDYNDVWNNTGGDYFFPSITPGAHDISADPRLVDPANGDFHLAADSPCIDAGDPDNYPPTDFEGEVRPNGPAPDIGPDEYYARMN